VNGICLKLWKATFSIALVDASSPYKTVVFGTNPQLKMHCQMGGFSAPVTRTASGELLLSTCFLHAGECFPLLCDSLLTGTVLFCFLQGVLNARIPSRTGTMRKMGSCIATKTTGGSLGNLAMAALC